MSERIRRVDRRALSRLIEALPGTRRTRYTISSARIERIVAHSLAGYALIFGTQIVPAAFAGQPGMNKVWAWTAGIALFGSLAALVVAGVLVKRTKTVAGILSAIYLLVIITWPFAALDPAHVATSAPWPSPLSTVAFAAAAFAFSRRVAIGYVAAVYVSYVLVRASPAGGGVSLVEAMGEAGYGVILGISVLLLLDMFRRAAAAVDKAHGAATGRYTRTVREHRTELERLQVDSILHDSVLTTFLTAARAESADERRLSVAMAQHALAEVASAGALPDTMDDLVPLDDLRSRFETACRELGITAGFSTEGLKDYSVPGSVVEAFFSAVMQALTNSIQHGGGGPIARNVHIVWDQAVLTVDVTDDGVGFDTATMTPNRLGVRVSIIERVRNVGGEAEISSTPGLGTTVRLSWPRVAG